MSDLLFEDDKRYRRDLNLVLKALKERWEIPDSVKEKALLKAVELVDHHDPRLAVKAIQILASMEAQVQKDQHKYLDLMTAASQEKVTNNTFTQIAVGDLDSVYQLLDRMGSAQAYPVNGTPITGAAQSDTVSDVPGCPGCPVQATPAQVPEITAGLVEPS